MPLCADESAGVKMAWRWRKKSCDEKDNLGEVQRTERAPLHQRRRAELLVDRFVCKDTLLAVVGKQKNLVSSSSISHLSPPTFHKGAA